MEKLAVIKLREKPDRSEFNLGVTDSQARLRKPDRVPKRKLLPESQGTDAYGPNTDPGAMQIDETPASGSGTTGFGDTEPQPAEPSEGLQPAGTIVPPLINTHALRDAERITPMTLGIRQRRILKVRSVG